MSVLGLLELFANTWCRTRLGGKVTDMSTVISFGLVCLASTPNYNHITLTVFVMYLIYSSCLYYYRVVNVQSAAACSFQQTNYCSVCSKNRHVFVEGVCVYEFEQQNNNNVLNVPKQAD